jgi:glycosyltransferase involved in cell wall biosynthesis
MAKVVVDGRVLSHPQISGVERYVKEICRTLHEVKSGHDFLVAMPSSGFRISHHFWEHTVLPFLCLKEHADLLFCPANIAPVLYPRRVKLVVTIHGLAFGYYPEAYSKSFSFYYSQLIPRVLRSADAILAVSRTEKDGILDQYPWIDPGKIYPIHSGVNHDFFNLVGTDSARKILRQRYGIYGKFILSVGALTQIKNFRRLIDAFLSIATKSSARLVLVCGSGPYRNEAIERVQDPRVTIVPYVAEDLPRFYQAAELTVVPSKYEGFGFPALEAMACGCPVVVSNVSALPEICGDAAVYINPDDTQSIADGVKRALEDEILRSDLIERGYRRVKEFTWEKTARETLRIFDEILGKN